MMEDSIFVVGDIELLNRASLWWILLDEDLCPLDNYSEIGRDIIAINGIETVVVHVLKLF